MLKLIIFIKTLINLRLNKENKSFVVLKSRKLMRRKRNINKLLKLRHDAKERANNDKRNNWSILLSDHEEDKLTEFSEPNQEENYASMHQTNINGDLENISEYNQNVMCEEDLKWSTKNEQENWSDKYGSDIIIDCDDPKENTPELILVHPFPICITIPHIEEVKIEKEIVDLSQENSCLIIE